MTWGVTPDGESLLTLTPEMSAEEATGETSMKKMLSFLLEDRRKREKESEKRTLQLEKQIELLTRLVQEPRSRALRALEPVEGQRQADKTDRE